LPAPPGRNSETVDCAELKPIRAIVARVVAIIFDIIRIYEGNVGSLGKLLSKRVWKKGD